MAHELPLALAGYLRYKAASLSCTQFKWPPYDQTCNTRISATL